MASARYFGNHLTGLVKIIFSLLLLIFLMSCAASKKEVLKKEKTQAKTITPGQFDESFDPLSLEDDDIVIEKNVRTNLTPKTALEGVTTPSGNRETIPDSLLTYKEVDGYRVQIFAVRSVEAATYAKAKAKENFQPQGQKVYLIFEAPFYKLRVGDFKDRNQAEKFRNLAKKMGYKEAFVVRSKVRVVED